MKRILLILCIAALLCMTTLASAYVAAVEPIANFTANTTSGTTPLTVQFTDMSTNIPTSWAWDFDNDSLVDSSEQDPVHTYNDAGTYSVNLNVTNAAGNDSEVKADYVTVKETEIYGLADTAWPKYQRDLNNTGQSPYKGPETGNVVWTYTTGNDIYYSAPAIATDGTIYVGSRDNNLYALNPDGTLKWSYTTGGRIYGSVTMGSDGTIYVGSYDKKFYAINPDGTLKWSYTTGGRIYGSAAIGTDGTIYIGSRDNNLYALNPDGTLKWSYTTGNWIYNYGGSPAIGPDGTVYVGGYDQNLYALNPDGTLKWTYAAKSSICASPSIGSDGTIYVGSKDYKFYAINPNGTLKWNYATGDYIYGSAAIGTDGTIYVGSDDDYLYALNPDGTLKWRYNHAGGSIGTGFQGSPAIGSDGTIYAGNYDDSLYALNPDGTLKWAYSTGSSICASPAIGADGTLYIGSRDDKLYAFKDVAPAANFTFFVTNGTEGYVPLTVQFTDTSLYIPASWLWDFGDGTNSTEQNPSHTYSKPGNYSVSFTATNVAGSGTTVKNDCITVIMPSVPPVSNFTATPTSGAIPLSVQFTDQSTGIITSRAWDFNNDGTIDNTEQNPTYTYSAAGNYTVKLNVTNAAGSDEEVRPDYITVAAVAAPVVGFTATPESGCAPLTVRFNDTSNGSIISYAWDFNNDGTNDSTDKNASYTYTSGGTYTVNHTVTGWGGSTSLVKTDLITVTSSADLTISSTGLTFYPYIHNTLTATIKNKGASDAGLFKVNFTVDGNTTTIDVKGLSVGNTTTISVTDQVHRKYGDKVPVLISVDTGNVIDESDETNNEYNTSATVVRGSTYYFGGRYYTGNDIETGNFTEGNISVIYSLGDSNYQTGGGWYSTTVTWTSSDLPIPEGATVKAARLYQSYTWNGEPGFTVYFNGNEVDVDALYYDGDVEDLYFNGQGIYDVTPYFSTSGNTAIINAETALGGLYGAVLIVVYEDAEEPCRRIWLDEGCDTLYYNAMGTYPDMYTGYAIFDNVTTGNVGAAKITTVLPSGGDNTQATILFNNQSVPLSGSDSSKDPGFKYYDVTNALHDGTNELGLVQDGGYMNLAVVILEITEVTTSEADFTVDKTSGIAPLTVQFSDTSTGTPSAWSWDFGDGETSTDRNPSHIYDSEGSYTVTLTVSNSLGNDTETKTGYIDVAGTSVSFTTDTTVGTFPLTVQFTGQSTGSPTAWHWDFGDGDTSTDKNPVHTYLSAGTYDVNLTVTGSGGSDRFVKEDYISVEAITGSSLPLTTEQSGTVSGNLYVGSFQPVPFASQPTSGVTERDVSQSFEIPAYIDVQWARVYVNIYSGSGSANWPLLATTTLDGDGDGSYETTLGVENMDMEYYSADGTVYWLNNHTSRVYSDYEIEYDVTDQITSANPSVHVKIEKTGTNFDGRLKALTLVVAYNDGDSDEVKYWVNHGGDWIDSGSSSTTFATSSLTDGFTNATLSNVALSSTDGSYTFNSVSLDSANPISPINYYENHTWSVTDAITAGSDSSFQYSPLGSSFKTTLATLAVEYPAGSIAPSAGFSASPTFGEAPLTVNFTDESTNSPTSWSWDFGDGSTSTEQNPVHAYTAEGNYSIKLTVTNAGGSDEELKTDYITVLETSTPEPEPVAAFTADVTNGNSPLTVNFTDHSTGSPTSWLWDFGDDSNSTEQNPVHTYASAGSYTVNLTVENAAGTDFELKSDYIEVSEASGSTVTLYFDPESSSVAENESTEISIVASNFPTGLSGYNLTVAIDDPAVAEIVNIEYPTWALITENSTLPGTSIYLKTVDGEDSVKEGATDVVLATLTVSGNEKGSANLSIGVKRLEDDSGDSIEPALLAGTIEVTLLSPLPDQEYAPKDLDGDGLYEDLTGNGEFSFVDIVAYFHNMDWIEENMPVEYFDFNGNGRIDFDDVVDMFAMI
ncbi:PKD domain-containing protein [Methanosarcina siciliae]|uniref:PKD domain-containing protein n=1 Tax=Methanosarcina siciliae TaxID=38027 RepID=UPI000B3165FE|nr:PKD domain-containing protein [Methanosarcina siciliae]